MTYISCPKKGHHRKHFKACRRNCRQRCKAYYEADQAEWNRKHPPLIEYYEYPEGKPKGGEECQRRDQPL